MQPGLFVFRFILQNVSTPTCSEVLIASLLEMIKNTNSVIKIFQQWVT